jgi:formylmethanofuran dehydrogenase subunit E
MEILNNTEVPEDLKECIRFHGHLCPGIIYGYRVSKEAMRILELKRSGDEEVVAVCENDSCSVDALQIILGTTSGKGNLIIKNYGKNAYTVISRKQNKAYRFSRKSFYRYLGKEKEEFNVLEEAVASGTATKEQKKRQKFLKSMDLLAKPFIEIFETRETEFAMPDYAELASSIACEKCGEMTMATKLKNLNGKEFCVPCFETANKP